MLINTFLHFHLICEGRRGKFDIVDQVPHLLSHPISPYYKEYLEGRDQRDENDARHADMIPKTNDQITSIISTSFNA